MRKSAVDRDAKGCVLGSGLLKGPNAFVPPTAAKVRDIRPNNRPFVPGEFLQLFDYPFTTNVTGSLLVSPGQSFKSVTRGNAALMHNGSTIVKYIQKKNVSRQEELCPHLLFPRGLISVHIRNDVEKASECC